MRYRFCVGYNGFRYHGWQIQPDVRTVQGALERALARILDTTPDEVTVQGAGRTDAGVHALAQVAHFDVEHKRRTPRDLIRGLNALTDDDISLYALEETEPDFHARHDADAKVYRYRLWHREHLHPLFGTYTWCVPDSLDLEAMARLGAEFVGTHDFQSFRASGGTADTTIRTLEAFEVSTEGPLTTVTVRGNGFLRHMVRIMVGTLVDVTAGRLPEDVIERMLAGQGRRIGGMTAPGKGLTLERTEYRDYPDLGHWKGFWNA